MRILWICNTVMPVIAKQVGLPVGNKEGWLSGLADALLSGQQATDGHERQGITLAVAYPVNPGTVLEGNTDEAGKLLHKAIVPVKDGFVTAYAFEEDLAHPESYPPGIAEKLSGELLAIAEDFGPDVIHCFGTEYPHTCAICEAYPRKERLLISIQGLCGVYAESYMADLPERVIQRVTLRDFLKKDSLEKQQEKYRMRGEREIRSVKAAGHVSGRTPWDLKYTREWNPTAAYHHMNETLRESFYQGSWDIRQCEKHRIFLSQGDYPIKGLHYMLKALPEILRVYPDTRVYVSGNQVNQKSGAFGKWKISSYGRYINELIRNNQLEKCVYFLGGLDGSRMKEQYLRSYTFVCCSTIENSPNSLGEAMLLGVPCVTAEVGGIPGIFTAGEDGVTYPGFGSGDEQIIADRLAEAVLTLWSDEEQMIRYGQQAAAHARVTHDRERNQERLLEIYQEIAGEAR